MGKTDYRTVLTKADIVTMRQALREAIFLYSAEGTPPAALPRKAEFEKLLRKLNGASLQTVMFPSPPAKP